MSETSTETSILQSHWNWLHSKRPHPQTSYGSSCDPRGETNPEQQERMAKSAEEEERKPVVKQHKTESGSTLMTSWFPINHTGDIDGPESSEEMTQPWIFKNDFFYISSASWRASWTLVSRILSSVIRTWSSWKPIFWRRGNGYRWGVNHFQIMRTRFLCFFFKEISGKGVPDFWFLNQKSGTPSPEISLKK